MLKSLRLNKNVKLILKCALIFAAASALGFAGWYVGYKHHIKPISEKTSNAPANNADYKSYETSNSCSDSGSSWCKLYISDYKFGIYYPNGWTSIISDDSHNNSDGQLYSVTLGPTEGPWGESAPSGINIRIDSTNEKSLDKYVQNLVQGMRDAKNIQTTTSAVMIQKLKAIRIDYPLPNEGYTPVYSYVTYNSGLIYTLNLMYNPETPQVANEIAQRIINSFYID